MDKHTTNNGYEYKHLFMAKITDRNEYRTALCELFEKYIPKTSDGYIEVLYKGDNNSFVGYKIVIFCEKHINSMFKNEINALIKKHTFIITSLHHKQLITIN